MSGERLRNVKIHWLVALSVGTVLREARVAALDLNPASSLLLDVFDISTSMTNYLRSQIESRDRLEVNWDALFGPFALRNVRLAKCTKVKRVLRVQIHHARPGQALYV